MTPAASPAREPEQTQRRGIVIQLDSKTASLLTLVLTAVSFFGGWYVKDARAQQVNVIEVETLKKAVDEHTVKIEKMRPASEMVSKDQFNEYQSWVRETLTEMKSDIKEVKQNTKRR
jgi:hypothetical protein